MTSRARYVEFDADRLGEVVAAMDAIAAAREGWVNFEPAVREEDAPTDGGVFSLFSGKGPAIPLGTWTPAQAPRRGPPLLLGGGSEAGREQPCLAQPDASRSAAHVWQSSDVRRVSFLSLMYLSAAAFTIGLMICSSAW